MSKQLRRSFVEDQVLSAPPIVPFYPFSTTACGLGRSKGYDLYRRGEFPIPVLKVGQRLKCRRADLLRFLGLEQSGGTAA